MTNTNGIQTLLSASDVHLVPQVFTHDVCFEAEKKNRTVT